MWRKSKEPHIILYTKAITLLLNYFKRTAYIWSFHPSPYCTASYKRAADFFSLHFKFPWALTACWFPQVTTLKSWRNIQGAVRTEGCLTVLNGRIRFCSSLTSPWSTKILKRARPSWQESEEKVIELNLLTDNCNDDVMLERFSSVALQIAFFTSFPLVITAEVCKSRILPHVAPLSSPQMGYAALNKLKNSKQVVTSNIHSRYRGKLWVLSAPDALIFEARASLKQSLPVPALAILWKHSRRRSRIYSTTQPFPAQPHPFIWHKLNANTQQYLECLLCIQRCPSWRQKHSQHAGLQASQTRSLCLPGRRCQGLSLWRSPWCLPASQFPAVGHVLAYQAQGCPRGSRWSHSRSTSALGNKWEEKCLQSDQECEENCAIL